MDGVEPGELVGHADGHRPLRRRRCTARRHECEEQDVRGCGQGQGMPERRTERAYGPMRACSRELPDDHLRQPAPDHCPPEADERLRECEDAEVGRREPTCQHRKHEESRDRGDRLGREVGREVPERAPDPPQAHERREPDAGAFSRRTVTAR